jgi:zinc transporter ZupT
MGMLGIEYFEKGKRFVKEGEDADTAYIVLEGEVYVVVNGMPYAVVGTGAFIGVTAAVLPEVVLIGSATAKTDVRCLALGRESLDQLRRLSATFDQACRRLASERVGQVSHFIDEQTHRNRAWAQSVVDAVRQGTASGPSEFPVRAPAAHEGSPMAVWLGILLDGIPESIVIGAGLFGLLAGSSQPLESVGFSDVIPYALIAGLFLSNFPEALSSSANMLAQGWNRRRIFGMWFALMVTTAVGAGAGYLLAGVLSETWLVMAEGMAAGAMLTMIAGAMLPEAAAMGRPNAVGLSTLAGFLTAIAFKLLE